MTAFVVALPMYDWPETRDRTDSEWRRLRGLLREQGIDAPEQLARCNADLPPAPGGIRDAGGKHLASDPATLPRDQLDLHTLWRHPQLLLAQTCWGPMERGLADHVQLVGQPDYSAYEGGEGAFYSSAIVMRRSFASRSGGQEGGVRAATDGKPRIPLNRLTGARLAFNDPHSMSGIIALGRDLELMGAGLGVFPDRIETGSHRASVLAVAAGKADAAAIDCRTWDMIRRFQPQAAADVEVVGWTARRIGLPFVAARNLPDEVVQALRQALSAMEGSVIAL